MMKNDSEWKVPFRGGHLNMRTLVPWARSVPPLAGLPVNRQGKWSVGRRLKAQGVRHKVVNRES